ncbi:MAG: hypothetical protein K8S25_15780 [Alphaproteobacteria bacterium]|nr:hypothetical protein [Alphaproteobacteria bacterium]
MFMLNKSARLLLQHFPRHAALKGLLLLCSCFLFAAGINAAPQRAVAGATDEHPAIEDLAAEFRALRVQRGHFSGGDWNDALDKFDGRKHRVMLGLSQALGYGKHSRAEIVALMGEPDQILVRGDWLFAEAYSGDNPRVRELLVYHWRGGHDFLYFVSDRTQVLASGWWAALE